MGLNISTGMTSEVNSTLNGEGSQQRSYPIVQGSDIVHKKKYWEEEDSIYDYNGVEETSLSMISMIEDMKDLQRPHPEISDGGGNLLAMLN